ncbi:MAG: hypothetical protein RLY78_4285 [Pseudomonadota bacterium]|jgi:hypothetical protein
MKAFNARDALRVASAAAVLAAASTSASAVTQVVYDSLTYTAPSALYDDTGAALGLYGWSYVDWSGETLDATTTYNPVTSVGDLISLTGTLRSVESATVGLFQAASGGDVDFTLTMSIYDTAGNLLVSQTSANQHLDAVTSVNPLLPNGIAAYAKIDLGPFNLPDTFIYTVSLNTVSGDTDSLGFLLYDYYSNYGTIKGTDVGTTGNVVSGYSTDVYGQLLATDAVSTNLGNVDFVVDGYTPSVKFVAESVTAVVPEPETYAMMLAGLAVVGLKLRRRQAAQA